MNLYKMFFTVLLLGGLIFAQNETSLQVGDEAPDFTLEDAYDSSYTLSDYEGESPVVVYFYPKANTAGCTKEACGIRDERDKFKENNIKVFGISVDPKEDIKKFVDDYDLNFPLLSDYTKEVTKKYGVLSEGGTAKRVTFIIDKKGEIAKIINVTDISSHAIDVLTEAKKLN